MRVKASASFTGVISTGEYENARPGYVAQIEFEASDENDAKDRLSRALEDLQRICQIRFKQDEQMMIIARLQKDREDLKFYGEFPSVTSIIDWDADYFVSPQDLTQYASRGNLYHAQLAHYIQTGKWVDAKEIEGTWADIVVVERGQLRLSYDDWKFPEFLKKYPIERMEVGVPVISKVHRFGGTPDIRSCIYDGKRTLADAKSTPDKVKNFSQIAAYIIAEEENGAQPYDQMMIIPCSGKTEQGFSKPIVSSDILQYKRMFLRARENFKKRFNI